MLFSTYNNVDHPASQYVASKKANELMAHIYSHLYRLPTTGLRFFSIRIEGGRPDMSLFMFIRNIFERRPIDVFNYDNYRWDFTCRDNIAEG